MSALYCLCNLWLSVQDLVKSHLMSAVRSEVEELRDKISKLEVSVQAAYCTSAMHLSHKFK